MKKFFILILAAMLFTGCMPQESSPEGTQNPTMQPDQTEAPVTDGKAYFDPATVAENEEIGIFTVRKVLRDENGDLNAVFIDGNMTLTGEFYFAAMPDDFNASYYADENGKLDTEKQTALFRCDKTSGDALPKADKFEEMTLVIALAEGSSFKSEYGKAEITIHGFAYYAAPASYNYYSQNTEILTQTPLDASSFIR